MKRYLAIGPAVALCLFAATAHAADTPLIEAAKAQDRAAVRTLLRQRADVNAKQPDGATALHWAAQWNDVEIADLLIGAGADVNATNINGVTPLSLACTNGSAAMTGLLIKAGANVNAASAVTGETPLMTAARTGDVSTVRTLLDNGAAVNATEPHAGQTALMWAAAEGHRDVVQLLLARGAAVDARSKTKFTALLLAARTGDIGLIETLLASGADVNEESADGTTALVVATVRSHTALGKFLLEKGADPNRGPGYTPLHWAVGDWTYTDVLVDSAYNRFSENNEWSAVGGLPAAVRADYAKLLLAHGANPNARAEGSPPKYGASRAKGGALTMATPFFVAAKNGYVDLMRILLAAGADPQLGNYREQLPLMAAAGVGVRGPSSVPERDAFEAVKLCLSLGNPANGKDVHGETPLHAAAYRAVTGSLSIIRLLLDAGADINAKNIYGYTPLTLVEGVFYGGSSNTRSDEAAELLRAAGAAPSPPDINRDGDEMARRANVIYDRR